MQVNIVVIAMPFIGWLFLSVVLQQSIARHFRVIRPKEMYPIPSEQILKMFGMSCLMAWLLTLPTPPYVQLDWLGLRAFGLLVMVAGVAVSVWAQWTLGKNWIGGAGLHKRHKLIMSGPYQFVRHPMYSGFLLSALGNVFATLDVFQSIAMLLVTFGLASRAWMEEQLLMKKFRKIYPQYQTTTGLLVPRIRRT